MTQDAVGSTDLPLPHKRAGKVRDVYPLPDPIDGRPAMLLVATDRLSAFDVVLPTPIPGKGRLLTSLSRAWFGWIEERGLCPTHLLGSEVPSSLPIDGATRASLAGRTTVALACSIVPIECVARGYLDGSGWKEYRRTGAVSGVDLPPGLQRGSRLPEPIFTPATKAEPGAHDENITFDEAVLRVGGPVMERLRAVTLRLYDEARAHALARGLVLADTKFEFGVALDRSSSDGSWDPEQLILADEALTPDSSRYWSAEAWSPGGAQASFDKQFVRDYLQGLIEAGAWDASAPGPALPDEVVRGTIDRYERAQRMLFPG